MKFYRLACTTFYDCINIFKPFLDNEMSIFEEYGAFKLNLSFFTHIQQMSNGGYFSPKIGFDISCKLSVYCQGKIRKNVLNCLLKFLPSMLSSKLRWIAM